MPAASPRTATRGPSGMPARASTTRTPNTAESVSMTERDLAAYYDQEVADRARRPLDQERIDGRKRFINGLGDCSHLRLLEIGTGAGRDAAAFLECGMQVYGVDISAEQSRHAARQGVR